MVYREYKVETEPRTVQARRYLLVDNPFLLTRDTMRHVTKFQAVKVPYLASFCSCTLVLFVCPSWMTL